MTVCQSGPLQSSQANPSHSPFDAVILSPRRGDGVFSVRSSKAELMSSNLLEHRTHARGHMTIHRLGDSLAAFFKGGEQCTKVMLEHFFVANRRTSAFGERIGK